MEEVGTQVAPPIFIHQSLAGRFLESHPMAKKRSSPFQPTNFHLQQPQRLTSGFQESRGHWNPKGWDWDSARFLAKPLESDVLRAGTATCVQSETERSRGDESGAAANSGVLRKSPVGEDDERFLLKLGGGVVNSVEEPSSRRYKKVRSGSPYNGYRDSVPPTEENRAVVEKEVYPAAGQIIRPNLKMFTFSELKNATRNFKPDSMLGEGGFGRVFKGWVDEKTLAPSKVSVGIPVAVKRSNPDSEQGLKEWQAEVTFLGKFSHPNLVKLLGYCWEDKEFLLVYEYMQKGSLESHLFRKASEQLPWETRLKIAIGAARGLTFLHTTEKQVIYRDFKTSNILLDAEFNAKLSDFGLAKLGPIDGDSHVSTGIVGTYGYAAPEYIATGHLYVRSDVYGFGVVLLEILTGRRVLDMDRPHREYNLVEWAKPFLSVRKMVNKIMDPNLGNQYPLRGAFEAAVLVLKCLESDPKNRPSIPQVLETLEQINTIKMKPKVSKPKVSRNNGNTVNAKPSWQKRCPHNHERGNLL